MMEQSRNPSQSFMPQSFIALFEHAKAAHGSQRYVDKGPYWHHCWRVGMLLDAATHDAEEGSEENGRERQELLLAGFCHDVVEDTKATVNDINQWHGSRVALIVEHLTDDGDLDRYVEHVAAAPEDARLVKLADLIDNYNRLAHKGCDNNIDWLRKNALNRMEPMADAMLATRFHRWKRTGESLQRQLRTTRRLAHAALHAFEHWR